MLCRKLNEWIHVGSLNMAHPFFLVFKAENLKRHFESMSLLQLPSWICSLPIEGHPFTLVRHASDNVSLLLKWSVSIPNDKIRWPEATENCKADCDAKWEVRVNLLDLITCNAPFISCELHWFSSTTVWAISSQTSHSFRFYCFSFLLMKL